MNFSVSGMAWWQAAVGPEWIRRSGRDLCPFRNYLVTRHYTLQQVRNIISLILWPESISIWNEYQMFIFNYHLATGHHSPLPPRNGPDDDNWCRLINSYRNWDDWSDIATYPFPDITISKTSHPDNTPGKHIFKTKYQTLTLKFLLCKGFYCP